MSLPYHSLTGSLLHILTEERIAQPNSHSLGLRIIRQRRLTQLPPNPTLLIPTKRQLMMQHVILIHPNRARLERTRNHNGRIQILGVHGSGEPISGAVAQPDGVVFGLEFRDRADGAEAFFLHDLHVFGDVGEDCRLDEVAFVAVAFAAGFDLRAFFFAVFDVAKADTVSGMVLWNEGLRYW